ncbi:MAG TPA: BlaI/MecI/CopY family transcriptional regulator [Sphingomicrobium sp.]|nr:BlaI/MecI/CopY family transcriptional regulator [Sphingomicrobium sp.]
MLRAEPVGGVDEPFLPARVCALPPREREVAILVYACGAATAHEVQKGLSVPLTIYAVRTMLTRLTAKRILRRRAGCNHRTTYVPAIVTRFVWEQAFNRLVDEHFAGQTLEAAKVLSHLVRAEISASHPVKPVSATAKLVRTDPNVR